ncbi:hypothetical protein OPT61_g9399 [Boeremia exigua]|uniref:Uncharacterized protein n=1 Tax=Boeremia exigua TaxID=749465 RepID=A0ACC2HUI5_9PLEO|nr:hypothetical protein OPT61_g9399 [Boeremia exigua]
MLFWSTCREKGSLGVVFWTGLVYSGISWDIELVSQHTALPVSEEMSSDDVAIKRGRRGDACGTPFFQVLPNLPSRIRMQVSLQFWSGSITTKAFVSRNCSVPAHPARGVRHRDSARLGAACVVDAWQPLRPADFPESSLGDAENAGEATSNRSRSPSSYFVVPVSLHRGAVAAAACGSTYRILFRFPEVDFCDHFNPLIARNNGEQQMLIATHTGYRNSEDRANEKRQPGHAGSPGLAQPR